MSVYTCSYFLTSSTGSYAFDSTYVPSWEGPWLTWRHRMKAIFWKTLSWTKVWFLYQVFQIQWYQFTISLSHKFLTIFWTAYIGCINDREVRFLDGEFHYSDTMTNRMCTVKCRERFYDFSGTQVLHLILTILNFIMRHKLVIFTAHWYRQSF